MGYMDKSDHMTNSYSIADELGKWTDKLYLFFWTLPLSAALSFLPLVVQNCHTDSSDWHWWGT